MATRDDEAAADGKKDDIDVRIEKALIRFSVRVGLISPAQCEAELDALDQEQAK